MNKPIAAIALSLSCLFLAGCSAAPAGDGRACIEVPAAVKSAIAEGANGAAITPGAAGAVKSKAMNDVTIVAMEFTTPDGETSKGVWGVGGDLASAAEAGGTIVAIDGFAGQFTDWPKQINGHTFDVTEDGADEALACLAA
ncbi:hypothetical protein [Leucobacter iarius]|uniref:Lipoprotein n=1 Tax=Leucobacter iarius TaxID=333963 RepID=A0ABN2LMJ8_9MICO